MRSLSWEAFLVIGIFAAGCGMSETTKVESRGQFVAPTGTITFLKAFEPQLLSFDRNPENAASIIPVQREGLQFHQYDVVSAPELSPDRNKALSLITGMGISAVDLEGKALRIDLGLIARQFDILTGSFSETTRIFTNFDTPDIAQGSLILAITNTDSPNNFMTGMALRLKEGRIIQLSLQHKDFRDICKGGGSSVDGARELMVENCWAVTGIMIRVLPNQSDTPIPFVQDALFYTAQLAFQ